MYQAPDYNNIIKLFEQYNAHPRTKVTTMQGFKRYMLLEQKFPAWMVKSIMSQVRKDADLTFHINAIIEAELVEGMIVGYFKEAATKFYLKNTYNYEETPEKAHTQEAKVKQISFVPAKAPQLEDTSKGGGHE